MEMTSSQAGAHGRQVHPRHRPRRPAPGTGWSVQNIPLDIRVISSYIFSRLENTILCNHPKKIAPVPFFPPPLINGIVFI